MEDVIVYSESPSALLQYFIMDVKDSVKRSCKVSMEDGGYFPHAPI